MHIMRTDRSAARRRRAGLAAILLGLSLGLAACGGGTASTGADSAPAQSASAEQTDAYALRYRDVVVPVGVEAAGILAQLGEATKVFRAPSCLFDGEDEVHSYPGIEIYVGSYKGEDLIAAVFIEDDSVATTEGLKIGDDVGYMKSLYGSDYREAAGAFTYTRGKSDLAIVSYEDEITSIAYYGVFD